MAVVAASTTIVAATIWYIYLGADVAIHVLLPVAPIPATIGFSFLHQQMTISWKRFGKKPINNVGCDGDDCKT